MPSDPPNLSDPDFEPSDEDLKGLSARAFAGVNAEHQASLERLRAEIATARVEAPRALRERSPRGP